MGMNMAAIRPPEHYSNVKELPVEMEGAEKCTIRWLLHKGKGANNFAMRLFTLYKDGHTPYHSHDFEHEIFCVGGEGAVVIEGTGYPFLPGYYGIVPGGVMHNFVNKGDGEAGDLILLHPLLNKGGYLLDSSRVVRTPAAAGDWHQSQTEDEY